MYNRESFYTGITEAFSNQLYASAPNGRPRILSVLAGSMLGISQVIPAENMLNNAQRFKFDIVEPSIARFAEYVANRHISSTPTLRTTTLAAIDLRLALAHNPLELKSPIESLNWVTTKYKHTLFKDNVLNVFRKLNISPFDIEIKYLFKAFAEAEGNLYQTTMNGIQAYCRRTYTRVNGTQIPLPSITEEELAIIASGYLGILVAYILPLPITPVDNLQMFWTTNILPQVFKLVDEFNERNIMDTKHIETIAKCLYFTRYNVVHAPHEVAHTLVYLMLTGTTTNLPAALLENVDENLRDQIADDVRDVLYKSCEKNENPFSNMEIAYHTGFVDLGEIDNEIIDSINNDLDKLYRLQDEYTHGAIHESDVIALENLHARYYPLVKPIHALSLEDMQSDKYRGAIVSTEGVGLIIVGVIAAAIAAAILVLKKIFDFFTKSKNKEESLDKSISQKHTALTQSLKEINDNKSKEIQEIADKFIEARSNGVKLLNDNFMKTRQAANIIARYNPKISVPQNIDTIEMFKIVGKHMDTRQTLEAVMLTRSDNQSAPQVPTFMYDRKAYNLYTKQIEELNSALNEGLLLVESLSNRAQVEKQLKDKTFVTELKRSKYFQDSGKSAEIVKQVVEQLSITGPVNGPEILDIPIMDRIRFGLLTSKTNDLNRHIAKLQAVQRETVKAIEDMVTKGLVDEAYAKEAGTKLKAVIKETTDIAVSVARCYKVYIKSKETIDLFFKDFYTLVTYRKLFETDVVRKAIKTIERIPESDSDELPDNIQF